MRIRSPLRRFSGREPDRQRQADRRAAPGARA